VKLSSFTFLSARLRVADLPRTLAFYRDVLGLWPLESSATHAVLAGAPGQEPVLTLEKSPGVVPRPREAAGLFHLALLVVDRGQLGGTLRSFAKANWPLDGVADHGVSEALYFTDPEGNGLELYMDRPNSAWPLRAGRLSMYTHSLNLRELVALAPEPEPAHPLHGVRLGHVHLEVQSLETSQRFFTETFGFDSMQEIPGAVFLSADGYHHHIGANVWGGRSQPAAANAVGLAEVNARAKGVSSASTVIDPDGNRFVLQPLV
jgi:catechol 2,3-dioxygenase